MGRLLIFALYKICIFLHVTGKAVLSIEILVKGADNLGKFI